MEEKQASAAQKTPLTEPTESSKPKPRPELTAEQQSKYDSSAVAVDPAMLHVPAYPEDQQQWTQDNQWGYNSYEAFAA